MAVTGEIVKLLYFKTMSKIIWVNHKSAKLGELEFEVVVDDNIYNNLRGFTLSVQVNENYKIKRVLIYIKPNEIPLTWWIMGKPVNGVWDHINHLPLDNRKENLRYLPGQLNQQNRKLRIDTKTGFMGVTYCADRCAFRAIYRPNGTRHQKDGFKSARDAAVYYDILVRKYSLLPDAPTNEGLGLIKPETQVY